MVCPVQRVVKSPFINGKLSSVTFHGVAICKSVTGKNNCWCAISINYKVKLFCSYCGLVFFFFFKLTRLGKC